MLIHMYPRCLLQFKAYYDASTQALVAGKSPEAADAIGRDAELLVMRRHDEILADVAKRPQHFAGLTPEERAVDPSFLSAIPYGSL